MLGLAEAGQVGVNRRGDRALVAEVDLDLPEVLPLFEQMRGVGVAQRVNVRLLFDAAAIEGEAEGALQRGATHRFGRGARTQPAVAFGGKEQDRMAVRLPLLAQENQGALWQRDVTVLIALARPDVQEHAFGINVTNLQAQAFPEAQAAGVNRDQGEPMIQRGHRRQDAAHLGGREHDGQFELRIGPGQLQFVGPDPLEGFFPEELDGADGLGAGLTGHLPDGLEMDAILADLLGRDQLGGLGVELAELTQAGEVGLLGARADRQQFEIVGKRF